MKKLKYDKKSALNYAMRWANNRNPIYYNFDKLGGDCTNFVSQCIFAGAKIMNFNDNLGWYYNDLNNRAPAWTGVKFLYDFLTQNQSFGPFAIEVSREQIQIGDVIFLINFNNEFYHSLFVSRIEGKEILCSAHTFDTFNRPLSSYFYNHAKFVHILGVNA